MDNISLLGLTGGIGCGKSTALKAFSLIGCDTLDADKICHDLYEEPNGVVPGSVYKRWGDKVLNSNKVIDRQKIAEIVFHDEKERQWLNQLIHPLVLERAKKISLKSKPIKIFDVPLLFEAGWEKHFIKTITVWTTPEIQHERLSNRGWTDQEIKGRIDAQMKDEEKLSKADFALINIGSFEFLLEQCKNILIEVSNYGV